MKENIEKRDNILKNLEEVSLKINSKVLVKYVGTPPSFLLPQ